MADHEYLNWFLIIVPKKMSTGGKKNIEISDTLSWCWCMLVLSHKKYLHYIPSLVGLQPHFCGLNPDKWLHKTEVSTSSLGIT